MKNQQFHLMVQSREGVVYEGNVVSITSFNEEGEFDILAQHANFISLIQKKLIVRNISGEQREIQVDNALLRLKKDKVEVYLGAKGIRPAYLRGAI